MRSARRSLKGNKRDQQRNLRIQSRATRPNKSTHRPGRGVPSISTKKPRPAGNERIRNPTSEIIAKRHSATDPPPPPSPPTSPAPAKLRQPANKSPTSTAEHHGPHRTLHPSASARTAKPHGSARVPREFPTTAGRPGASRRENENGCRDVPRSGNRRVCWAQPFRRRVPARRPATNRWRRPGSCARRSAVGHRVELRDACPPNSTEDGPARHASKQRTLARFEARQHAP